MKFWNIYFKTLMIECVAAVVIIIFAFVLKLCFAKNFDVVREWYIQNVMADTNIYEVVTNEV